MRKLLVMALLTGVLLLFSIEASPATAITLAADVWMPYSGDGTTTTGYLIDIAKAIFEKNGYVVQYTNLPWSRAISESRNGNYDGIVGAFKDDAPDFIFPQTEMGISINKFFVRKGFNWTYTGIQSLSSIVLGVIQDYDYGNVDLMNYIDANKKSGKVQFMTGNNPLSNLLQMLVTKRIDAVIDDQFVIGYQLNLLQLRDKVSEAGTVNTPANVYIAFTPAKTTSAAYAKILSDGIAALRKSGALSSILAKYGLTDWR